MASVRPIPLGSAAGRAGGPTSVSVETPVLDPAIPRALPARVGARGERRTHDMVLMLAGAALIGLPAVVLAGVLAVLALALAGPYMSLAVLGAAYALIALVAVSACG
jgi:hypothetical protein